MSRIIILILPILLLAVGCTKKQSTPIAPDNEDSSTQAPANPTQSQSLASMHTQKLNKSWLWTRHVFGVYKQTDTNGQYYNDTADYYQSDTTMSISVISDSVIKFMGERYIYRDVYAPHWLKAAEVDTSTKLLYYLDGVEMHKLSFLYYYYKEDSVVFHRPTGGGWGFTNRTFFTK